MLSKAAHSHRAAPRWRKQWVEVPRVIHSSMSRAKGWGDPCGMQTRKAEEHVTVGFIFLRQKCPAAPGAELSLPTTSTSPSWWAVPGPAPGTQEQASASHQPVPLTNPPGPAKCWGEPRAET